MGSHGNKLHALDGMGGTLWSCICNVTPGETLKDFNTLLLSPSVKSDCGTV